MKAEPRLGYNQERNKMQIDNHKTNPAETNPRSKRRWLRRLVRHRLTTTQSACPDEPLAPWLKQPHETEADWLLRLQVEAVSLSPSERRLRFDQLVMPCRVLSKTPRPIIGQLEPLVRKVGHLIRIFVCQSYKSKCAANPPNAGD